MGFNTRAIHAGQEADPATGAVIPPMHLTTTYKQDGVGGLRGGYEYSRSGNPTRTALHEALASLEQGTRALAFASGLAAEDTLLRTVCRPGDHVVLGGDAYGGTFRLISRVLSEWGLEYSPVHLDDPDAVRAAIRPNTRVVWCETPSNPLLNITDIEATAAVAHQGGAQLLVDNTFASPYLQRPLTLGADVVVHSTTKYLGGHSDVVGGALVVRDAELGERLAYNHNAMGAIAAPFDSWLLLRSLKTLGVRMERHCANAGRVAEFLVEHPAVATVLYPGLPTHPGHDIAARQMAGFGGMVSFRLEGGEDAALKVCELAQLFTLAESLGGVE
jgi:cystathionine gamma-synthase